MKTVFVAELRRQYGETRKLARSQSLYDFGSGLGRIYVRYSKLHEHDRAFYGLRKTDLQKLRGCPSFLCFLWDGQTQPLILPFARFQHLFQEGKAAEDGQYKVQIFLAGGVELYVAGAGRVQLSGDYGWETIARSIGQGGENAANV